MRILLTSLLIILGHALFAQETATIRGVILDRMSGEPIELVSVFVRGTQNVVETGLDGRYRLQVEANRELEIVFSRIGYQQASQVLVPLSPGAVRELNVELALVDSDLEVIVTERQIEEEGEIREDVEALKLLPTTTGNLESALPHIALGTSSGTGGELSSQYNVRGGNYDENLIYVNDFEIFRPQLVSASVQEGLSFPNIDLIRDLAFSSGGFESKYGDKMSSVLDVYYKRPTETRASVEVGLLGASAHVEGSVQAKSNRLRHFRYLVGARYKTTRLLLSSLDVKGEYVPKFFDFQAYLTYDITTNLQLGIIGNYNSSIYELDT